MTRILLIALTFLSSSLLRAQEIRKPEVAGSFYPMDASALKDSIAVYMQHAQRDTTFANTFGAIIPHAGYVYSGRIAAKAYHALAARHVRTVILLGPSHRGSFEGAALHHATMWETPLGRLQLDTAAQREIAQACPFVKVMDSAFAQEHSVEDQVPFVQQTFGNVKIVPIACGWMQPTQLLALGRVLERIVRERHDSVLIIASSDMSHYQTMTKTLDRDWLATQDILSMDPDKTYSDIIQRKSCELCGYAPAVALMYAAEYAGCNAHALGYSTSAWATGDTSRVVGYGAFAFTRRPEFDTLGVNDQHALLRVARMMIDSLVRVGRHLKMQVGGPTFGRLQGAFVTLKENNELRGCIGYMEPIKPLAQTVVECAISAATNDSRFRPLATSELDEIKIEISILSPLKRVRTMDDIVLGKTGLVIEMEGKRGVFLPQVAKEFGWDKEEFLKQLCFKAGLKPEDWKSPQAKISSFTAQVFSE